MKKKCIIVSISFIFKVFFSCFWSETSEKLMAQEICNNAIDDDADGLIDLNDTTDCKCAFTPKTIPSIIPNPSFEEMDYCPTSFGEMSAAKGWVQATDASTDYMNTCGYVATSATSSGLVPFPDGNGIVGAIFLNNYKEYVGSCLHSPLLAGKTYTLKINIASIPTDGYLNYIGNTISYSPIDISIFGSNSCSNLPVPTIDCPTIDPAWSELGFVTYTPKSQWEELTITFTPSTDVNSIIIGAPCGNLPFYPDIANANYYPYFYFDNLILNESSLFGPVYISKTGNYCSDNIVLKANLTATVSANYSFQWYKSGISIIGATDSVFVVPADIAGLENYEVKLTDNGLCKLSYPFSLNLPSLQLSINYPSICSGDTAIITASNNFESYVWSATSGTTYSIKVTPLVTTNYTVAATTGHCTESTITVVTVQSYSINISDNTTICFGESSLITASGLYNYQWTESSDTQTLDNYAKDSVTATPNYTTTYSVNGTFYYTNDKFEYCKYKASTTVNVIPLPSIFVTSSSDYTLPIASISICEGESINVKAFGAIDYMWNPSSNLTCNSCSSVTFNKPKTTATYTILGNAEICSNSSQFTVIVIPFCQIEIPNVITPNGDSQNEFFLIKNLESHPNSSIIIYDRWGKKVYENDNYKNNWNAEGVSDGIFYYILNVLNDKEYNGFITVLKN